MASVALCAMTVSPGLAQETGASSDEEATLLEEIVVTAAKRGRQSLQDIPIAVQVIDGDILKDMGATEFIDFALSVSGLQFQDLGPGDKEYILRGINSSGASTVGVYYDEAVITGSNKEDGGGRAPDIRLYDIARIEVLKGPQGTLYGANSLAGTIRLITNKPILDTVEGYVEAEISSTSEGGANYNFNAMVNAPIIEGILGLRAVGWVNDNSGFIDSVRIPSGPIKNVNTDNTEGGRFMLRLAPSDELTVTASATIQNLSSKGSSRFTPKGETSFGLPDLGFPAIPGGDLVNIDIAQSPWEEEINIYGGVAEYDTQFGNITATTNFFERDVVFLFDTSPFLAANPGFQGALPFPFTSREPRHRSIWSSEIRFASELDGPIQFVLGFFYQKEKVNFVVQTLRVNDFGLPRGPFTSLDSDDAITNFPDGNTIFGRINRHEIKQKAFFGEITYDVTDRLTALFGGRYFDSELKSKEFVTHPFFGFGGPPVFNVLKTKDNQDKFTKKFNLSYRLDEDMLTFAEDLLVYATAAQGFRVGGLNPADLPFAGGEIPRGFGPDKVWNFEAGTKANFWEGRGRLNLAGYSIIWKDLQLERRTSDGIFPFITNAGRARVDGLEFDLSLLPTDRVHFTFNGSWQHARLTRDTPDVGDPVSRGLDGNRIPNIPKFQSHVAVDYSFPVDGGFTGKIRTDISYHGSSRTELRKSNPFNVRLDDYFVVNLRASLESERWLLTAFIDNVTDKRAQLDAINSEQDGKAFLTIRPITAGGSLTLRF